MKTSHPLIDRFHWPLFTFTLLILAAGLFNLYSAAFTARSPYFISQVAWCGLAAIWGAAIFFIDYRLYERIAYFVYGFVLLLLILVLLRPPVANAHRWLGYGPFGGQPSELMKIALVLVIAKFFHHHAVPPDGFTLWPLRRLWVLILAPFFLILVEPDLGTAMLIAMIAGTLLLFVKMRWRTLVVVILICALSAVAGWHYGLKDYQKKRLVTLVSPGADPRGSGYHRRQSVIAVGSGEFWGKGFLNGTQTQLRFLPEQHTDFIFSVWAEEQGFKGSAALWACYLGLVFCGIHIAGKAREKFGVLAAVGATAILFWQAFINIGMVIGVMPVVGVTLPFMSYGGTSLLISITCVALLLNIYSRRYLF